MKVKDVIHLKCQACKSDYLPSAVIQGDDGHWYIIGKCPKCKDMVGANLETLYTTLYSAKYNDPKGN